MEKLIILWLWWAWYSSAIYAVRYWLSPLLIWEADGWMIVWNHMVENFSWYPDPVAWYVIMDNMRKQAERFDVRIKQDKVVSILPIDINDLSKWYKVKTMLSWDYDTQMLILWLWTEKIKLNAENESDFFGRWVSYCATCDGFFYRWKTTAVVGWWDTALIEALYLSDICKKVYLIHRRNRFRGEPIWLERAKAKINIEIITPAIVKEIIWEEKVNELKLWKWVWSDVYDDCQQKDDLVIGVDGLFVAVGTKPMKLDGLDDYIQRDDQWYIIVDKHQMTNLPWVFSAWDCTTWSAKFRQLITACAEWAIASEWAFQYFSKLWN